MLRGNPDMVAAVADSLEFERKYTSVVIAWAPDDRPTEEQIGAVLDEFEETAWAGLEPDRYAWTAVLHRERGGGVHVHVLAAQCDLDTARSLNIAPPGWQKTFDPRELIRDYLVQRVEHGAVQSRPDVVSALEEVGFEVPRQGKNYVTARDPDSGKWWRLRGALYEHDFQRERFERPMARLGNPSAMRGGHGGPANPPRALPLWRQHGPAAVGESADVDRAGSVLRHGLGHWLGGGTPSPRHDRSVPHAAAGRDVPGHPRGGRREPRGGGYSALRGSCSMA